MNCKWVHYGDGEPNSRSYSIRNSIAQFWSVTNSSLQKFCKKINHVHQIYKSTAKKHEKTETLKNDDNLFYRLNELVTDNFFISPLVSNFININDIVGLAQSDFGRTRWKRHCFHRITLLSILQKKDYISNVHQTHNWLQSSQNLVIEYITIGLSVSLLCFVLFFILHCVLFSLMLTIINFFHSIQ